VSQIREPHYVGGAWTIDVISPSRGRGTPSTSRPYFRVELKESWQPTTPQWPLGRVFRPRQMLPTSLGGRRSGKSFSGLN
jgi:hypothetical protein